MGLCGGGKTYFCSSPQYRLYFLVVWILLWKFETIRDCNWSKPARKIYTLYAFSSFVYSSLQKDNIIFDFSTAGERDRVVAKFYRSVLHYGVNLKFLPFDNMYSIDTIRKSVNSVKYVDLFMLIITE